MHTILPETGFLRLKQIIGDPKSVPPVIPIIPIKKSTLYLWISEKRFPAPVKLGRCSVWRVEDIKMFIENAGA